jgi:periplasmic protein TonB
MSAAGRKRAGQVVLVLAGLALAACSSDGGGGPPPPGPIDASLIERSAPSSNTDRPEFYVQWSRSALAGLTQRPTIDKTSKMPEYPRAALRSRASGTTTLEVCVTAEGRVVDVRVRSSSGSEILDDATVEWAKTARYLPAKFNDEAFAVCGYTLDWVWQYEEGQQGG